MAQKQANQGQGKRNQWLALSWKIGALVLIGSAVSIFQNCSQAPDGGTDQETVLAQKLDFTYDTTVDQIAYMSCPLLTAPYDYGTYFSFRVGAYRTAGIKLSDIFFKTYGQRSVDLMSDLLTKSYANSSTVLQLAVRQSGDLNSLVIASGTATAGVDYDNMLDTLGTVDMNTSLINTGMNRALGTITETRTKYMRNGTFQGAHIEGSLQMATSEALQSSVRSTYLSTGQARLTVTYNEPGTGTSSSNSNSSGTTSTTTTDVRSPSTAFPYTVTTTPTPTTTTASSAYGLGFTIAFSQPSIDGKAPVGLLALNTSGQTTGQQTEPYPINVMTGVQESNLLTSSSTASTGTWVCPTDLQFKIIRNTTDIGAAGSAPTVGTYACVAHPDPIPAPADLTIARNTLRVEDWYIDMPNHCIIPKNAAGNCYGALNYVNYDYTNTAIGCDPNSTTSSNELASPVCLAWASICYRLPL